MIGGGVRHSTAPFAPSARPRYANGGAAANDGAAPAFRCPVLRRRIPRPPARALTRRRHATPMNSLQAWQIATGANLPNWEGQK